MDWRLTGELCRTGTLLVDGTPTPGKVSVMRTAAASDEPSPTFRFVDVPTGKPVAVVAMLPGDSSKGVSTWAHVSAELEIPSGMHDSHWDMAVAEDSRDQQAPVPRALLCSGRVVDAVTGDGGLGLTARRGDPRRRAPSASAAQSLAPLRGSPPART